MYANECFEKGEMSRSQKQAVITVLERSVKDRALLENWRPTSPVNVDTKIMSKVIAARVKKVLSLQPDWLCRYVLSEKQYLCVLFSILWISQLRKHPRFIAVYRFSKRF